MTEMTIGEVLDDLRSAEEVLRKFERRYWITSEQFFELYQEGRLDTGEHTEDFAEWAGFYKLKARREKTFEKFSQARLKKIKDSASTPNIQLEPQEPIIEVV